MQSIRSRYPTDVCPLVTNFLASHYVIIGPYRYAQIIMLKEL